MTHVLIELKILILFSMTRTSKLTGEKKGGGGITLHDNGHQVHKEPLLKMRYYGRKYHENNNPMRIVFKHSKFEPQVFMKILQFI